MVGNGAGAVLLAVAALAGPGGRVIVVSRGQLVEIGGGFRIPEVIAASRAPSWSRSGTTNRTRLERLRSARSRRPAPAVILRVHQSNFRTVGFVAEAGGRGAVRARRAGDRRHRLRGAAPSAELAGARRRARTCATRCAPGAALVCCSGDKLLGGPQAGLLVGRATAVAAAAAPPAGARAADRQALAGRARGDAARCIRDPERARREIPVLAMLAIAGRACWRRGPSGSAEGSARARRGGRTRSPGSAAARCPLLELPGPGGGAAPAPTRRRWPRRCAAASRRSSARIDDGRAAARPAHARPTSEVDRRWPPPSAARSRDA